MKRFMKRFLFNLATKIVGIYGHKLLPVPPHIIRLVVAVLPWVIEQEERRSKHSGEYRRHQVYAKALKKFPHEDKADIGLAVELAVRRMKGK